MTNSIPDYSNLKANLSSMTRFFNDQGVNLTESEKDKNIEEQLTGVERTNFLEKIKQAAPNIYNKIVDFFVSLEVVEDMKKHEKESLEMLENENLKNKDSEPSEKFGLI